MDFGIMRYKKFEIEEIGILFLCVDQGESMLSVMLRWFEGFLIGFVNWIKFLPAHSINV